MKILSRYCARVIAVAIVITTFGSVATAQELQELKIASDHLRHTGMGVVITASLKHRLRQAKICFGNTDMI